MRQQYGFTRSEIKRFEKKANKDPQRFRSMSRDEQIAYIKKGRRVSRIKRFFAFIALIAIIWFVFSRPSGNRSGHNTTGKSDLKSTITNIPSINNTVIPLEEKTVVIITNPPPTNTVTSKSTSSNKYYVTAEPTEKPTPTAEPQITPEETDMLEAYDNNPSPKEIELVLNAEYYIDVSYLKGRGFSDYAGIEPNYVGAKGFAAVYCDEALENDKDCFNTPWRIPVYQMGDRGLVESGYIDHKSQIGILDQYLEKKNGKEYEGYLWFVDFASNMTGYINVKNYVTVAYWNYDAIDSVEKGYGIAEYKQTSKYNPILSNGNRVKIHNNERHP